MPATDKTWYNIKRLHAIFGVSGLILLFSTLWMFKADHQREWKQYQRKARSIDLRMADWRKLQQQTEVISNARQQIEKKLAEAREAPMDAARLKEFGDLAGEALAEASEKKLAAVIAASKQEESQLLGSLKFRRADLDKAKADLGLAVRDGLGQGRQEELQKDIDLVQVDVDQKTAAYEQAKDKRQKLQSVFSDLMKDIRDLEKQRDDSMAEEQRLIASIQDRQSKWFEGSWLGKRWLELPILDAFNSPLTIENLWSEDLEQDYSHRMVRRFDRCTTCHQSMEKTVPGSATEGAYLRERVVQLRLATPEQVRLQAIEDGTAQPPAEGGDDEGGGQDSAEAVSSTTELLNQYGIQLADAGLLNRGEVTVQFVEPRTLGAKAEPLLDIPVAEGHPVEDIVKSILESPGLSGVDLFTQTHVDTRLGFQLGDVLLAINDDPIESRGSAIRTRQSVVLRLLDLAKKKSPIEITVRRGLPHPFSSHPRLDLFVGSLSPHKMAQFACTVCHEGQGSATAFKWASHTPDSLGDRSDWMREHGWFDNHHWVYPMHPKRFMESSCLKCHHNVTELQPSEKFPEPPAPKLLKGYNLIRKYGCYGCHEVNGFEGPNKRVVLLLSSGDQIVLEPRMTGLVLLADPPNVEHLRLRIDLEQCPVEHLWFWDRRGLGCVYLLNPDEFGERLGPDRLGPDALKLDPERMRERLGASRREIKVALLDQRALAGVGNLYASELLHVAGVHPQKRCDRITRPQWERIHKAMEEVLLDAIEHEGSTLSDGTYRNALNQSGGYQNLHRVYDRAGELCPSCEAAIVKRIVQCQRSTFFCPHCQTKGVRRAAIGKPR